MKMEDIQQNRSRDILVSNKKLVLELTQDDINNGYTGFANNVVIPLNNDFESPNLIRNNEIVEDENDPNTLIETVSFYTDGVYNDTSDVVPNENLRKRGFDDMEIDKRDVSSVLPIYKGQIVNELAVLKEKNILLSSDEQSFNINNYNSSIENVYGKNFIGVRNVNITPNLATNDQGNTKYTITDNGVFDVPNGYCGFGKIEVAVPNAEDTSQNVISVQSSKTVSANQNGVITITPDAPNDALSEVKVNVAVESSNNLTIENSKTVDVNTNGTVVVSPTSGFDGIGSVTVNVAVPNETAGGVAIENEKEVTVNVGGTTIIEPSSGSDGIGKVIVNVPSTISNELETKTVNFNGGIGQSVSFSPSLGKVGFSQFNCNIIAPTSQSKTVTPSGITQLITPDSGYDFLSSVTVNPASGGNAVFVHSLENPITNGSIDFNEFSILENGNSRSFNCTHNASEIDPNVNNSICRILYYGFVGRNYSVNMIEYVNEGSVNSISIHNGTGNPIYVYNISSNIDDQQSDYECELFGFDDSVGETILFSDLNGHLNQNTSSTSFNITNLSANLMSSSYIIC